MNGFDVVCDIGSYLLLLTELFPAWREIPLVFHRNYMLMTLRMLYLIKRTSFLLMILIYLLQVKIHVYLTRLLTMLLTNLTSGL